MLTTTVHSSFSSILPVAALGLLIAASPARAAPPVPIPVPTAASAPASAAPVDTGRAIYQQRGADGKVTFTDRPAAGAATERRWQIEPAEDAASAAERREAGRAQADRVTERIQRSIEQQQVLNNDLQIEQLRAQRDADALAAQRLRERDREYEARPYVVLPGRPWNRPPRAQPTPWPSKPQPPHIGKPVRPPESIVRIGHGVPGALEAER